VHLNLIELCRCLNRCNFVWVRVLEFRASLVAVIKMADEVGGVNGPDNGVGMFNQVGILYVIYS